MLPEICILAFFLEQIFMVSVFYNLAILEYDNAVQVLDGAEAMGDDDGGAVSHELP